MMVNLEENIKFIEVLVILLITVRRKFIIYQELLLIRKSSKNLGIHYKLKLNQMTTLKKQIKT